MVPMKRQQLGDAWRVSLNDNLLQSLAAWLSADNVKAVYSESRE